MFLVLLIACMAWASNAIASHVHTVNSHTVLQRRSEHTDSKNNTFSGILHAEPHKNLFGVVKRQNEPAQVKLAGFGSGQMRLTLAPEKTTKPKEQPPTTSGTPHQGNAIFNSHKSSYALFGEVSFSSPNDEPFSLAFDTSNPYLTTLSATGQSFLVDADGTDNPMWLSTKAYDVESTGRKPIKETIKVNISARSLFTADEYIDPEVHVGGQLARNAPVLVAYEATLIYPVDGVFGISPEASVFSHMDLPERVIGLDLKSFSKNGGSFTIGSTSNAYGDLQFVNIVKKQANPLLEGKDLLQGTAYDLFAVDSASFTVNGSPTTLSGAIIDTSLVPTFLPLRAFKIYEKFSKGIQDASYFNSYMVPCHMDKSVLKSVSLEFGEAKLTFRKLVLEHNQTNKSLCVSAIQPWDQSYAAIGTHALIDNYIALYLKTDTQEPKVGIASKPAKGKKL